MTPEQEAALVNGGDCFSHWHSEDRIPTHDFLRGLQSTFNIVTVSSSFDASRSVDFYLVDSTSSPITCVLPKARGNRLITFVRTSGTNNVTLARTGTDTINGSTSLTISSSYSPVRLLALVNVGYIQV